MLLLVFDYVTFHLSHELHFYPHALDSLSNITSGDLKIALNQNNFKTKDEKTKKARKNAFVSLKRQ